MVRSHPPNPPHGPHGRRAVDALVTAWVAEQERRRALRHAAAIRADPAAGRRIPPDPEPPRPAG
jgi:hypothetical protein